MHIEPEELLLGFFTLVLICCLTWCTISEYQDSKRKEDRLKSLETEVYSIKKNYMLWKTTQ